MQEWASEQHADCIEIGKKKHPLSTTGEYSHNEVERAAISRSLDGYNGKMCIIGSLMRAKLRMALERDGSARIKP